MSGAPVKRWFFLYILLIKRSVGPKSIKKTTGNLGPNIRFIKEMIKKKVKNK